MNQIRTSYERSEQAALSNFSRAPREPELHELVIHPLCPRMGHRFGSQAECDEWRALHPNFATETVAQFRSLISLVSSCGFQAIAKTDDKDSCALIKTALCALHDIASDLDYELKPAIEADLRENCR